MPAWVDAWTLTRSAGIGGYVLLTLSVLVGLYQSIRTKQGKPAPIAAAAHVSMARWSLYLVLVHLILLAFDSYSNYSWSELLIPFTSHLEPIPMAFGIIAGYLLLFTMVTTELRTKIGQKAWKKLHMASPILYLLSTVHGIANGTDTGSYLPMYIASSLSVILMLVIRFGFAGKSKKTAEAS
nr:ferric reductase-like transmembrane domain-containing protein [Tumebacillus amylolyticus]